MKVLGLDISSSKIGIALIEDDKKILISEVIKLKSNQTLEQRALIFERRMKEIERHHVPFLIYIEQPAMMFKGGRTTAYTMATLQRFNGMCSYIVYKVFDHIPTMVNPKLGIKTPRKVPSSQVKKCIIEHVEKMFEGDFKYELTHKGNPRPGTDDRADAIVVAIAGPMLDDV